MFHLLFDPFIYHSFMRKGIVVCFALSLSSTPIGVFLLLRRMILIGDTLSHAILPGVAVGYFLSNTSIIFMWVGGLISGLLMAVFSGWISSKTSLKEDSSFAGVYLTFLAFGIILISLHGSKIDLLNLLFGSIFLIDVYFIKFIGVISSFTFVSLSLLYRALIIETFDVTFLQSNGFKYFRLIKIFFLSLVVLNLVASFQIVGTLMSVGLMILPCLSAHYWTINLFKMLIISIFIALLSSWAGLLCAFYTSLPAGPLIILSNSLIFLFSMFFGKYKKIVS